MTKDQRMSKDKRQKVNPILDYAIYGLMFKLDLEQFEGPKSIFNAFIRNNKDIVSQLKLESYEAEVSKTLTCFVCFFNKSGS